MKKIQLFFFLSCFLSVLVSVCSIASSSKKAVEDHELNRKIDSLIQYPRMEDGYTQEESLIEGIEEGENEIEAFVTLFGYDILNIVDPITNKSLVDLAVEVENNAAVQAIKYYLHQRWQPRLIDCTMSAEQDPTESAKVQKKKRKREL